MQTGVDVIYQAVLLDGRRLGYADFLRRIETPSDLGAWSYEVWDTKLARQPSAPAVLQICMYSDLLGTIQGRMPERMHLVLGGVERQTVSLRVADYAAYYRLVARDFEALLDDPEAAFPIPTKPEPVGHCAFCRWGQECRAQWRREDDLALVANLSSRQRRALHAIEVTTRRGLANPSPPLPERVEGVGQEALARVQAQAAIQVRGEGRVISERIPHRSATAKTCVGAGPRAMGAAGTLAGRPVSGSGGRSLLRLRRDRWDRLSLRPHRAGTNRCGGRSHSSTRSGR